MAERTFEFSSWDTPFTDANVTILEVRYGSGTSELEIPQAGMQLVLGDGEPQQGVLVRLFHHDDETVYRVSSSDAGAVRVLDEAGLTEIAEETARQGGRPGLTTFRVRNYAWSQESPLQFVYSTDQGWAYVIVSDFECVEILCQSSPEIVVEKQVEWTPI